MSRASTNPPHSGQARCGITFARLLRAEGTIVHPGSRVATAEAKLLDEDGTLFAHASSTFLVWSGEKRAQADAPLAA